MLHALFLVLVAQAPSLGEGDVRVATTAEVQRALSSARPGARILVAPGDYAGFHVQNVHGAQGKPIVFLAADPHAQPVFRGGVQFSDVSHLEIKLLVIEGAPANGLNVDDGGTFDTSSHHLEISDVTVRACGGRGNEDGIKLSGVTDFRLERCTVEKWGRGGSAVDMVGCRRGVIEACTFRDREDDTAATGVQVKGGTREVTLRNSRFEHAGTRAVNIGGSTGLAYFRPRPEGFEAKDIIVEGCTFLGSEAPIAFVGVDGAHVRWNTFYRPRKWFFRILQETTEPGFVPCRIATFTDNLVAWRSNEVATPVNVGPGTAPETFVFARNWWFCIDEPTRGHPRLPSTETDPSGGADPQFVDAPKGDFALDAKSPARAHGAEALPRAKDR